MHKNKSFQSFFFSFSPSNLQHRIYLSQIVFVMMVLSTYFNCDTLQFQNTKQSLFHEAMPPQIAAPNLEHYFPYSDENLFLSNVLFENYLDSTSGYLCPSEMCPSYNNDPFIPLTHHDIFPTHENDYNLLPCPKRQKCFHEEQLQQQQQQQEMQYSSMQEFTTPTLPSNFLDGFVVPNYDNCCSLKTEELQQQLLFSEAPQHGTTCVEVECEKKSNERTISPQSVAARERRRRITEKTQELGKLVPGGQKMNTAEMFHAAANYVKFLQAQVQMLQLINTLQEDKTAPPSESLHALVVSPFVQEKLYTEEMCVVPKEFVTTLTNHEDVQSSPTILEDLKQLIGTDIEKKPKQD